MGWNIPDASRDLTDLGRQVNSDWWEITNPARPITVNTVAGGGVGGTDDWLTYTLTEEDLPGTQPGGGFIFQSDENATPSSGGSGVYQVTAVLSAAGSGRVRVEVGKRYDPDQTWGVAARNSLDLIAARDYCSATGYTTYIAGDADAGRLWVAVFAVTDCDFDGDVTLSLTADKKR